MADKEDWEDIMKTTQGRRVMWQIMSDFGFLDDVDSSDPLITQRQLGQRDVTLYIYRKFMKVSPDKFIEMQQEVLNEHRRND